MDLIFIALTESFQNLTIQLIQYLIKLYPLQCVLDGLRSQTEFMPGKNILPPDTVVASGSEVTLSSTEFMLVEPI